MRVVGPDIGLERKVEELTVEVLLLVVKWHILVLVNRRQERTWSAQSVPRMVEVGGDGVGRSTVGRGG